MAVGSPLSLCAEKTENLFSRRREGTLKRTQGRYPNGKEEVTNWPLDPVVYDAKLELFDITESTPFYLWDHWEGTATYPSDMKKAHEYAQRRGYGGSIAIIEEPEKKKYGLIKDHLNSDRPVIMYISVDAENREGSVGVGDHYVVIEEAKLSKRFGPDTIWYDINPGWYGKRYCNKPTADKQHCLAHGGVEDFSQMRIYTRGNLGDRTSAYDAFVLNLGCLVGEAECEGWGRDYPTKDVLQCTDRLSDSFCGSCENDCGAGANLADDKGTCCPTAGPDGTAACVNIEEDDDFCGDCATACETDLAAGIDESCFSGACVNSGFDPVHCNCQPGEICCEGRCLEPDFDVENCGGCSVVVATPGVDCRTDDNLIYAGCCDGACVDFMSPDDCGGCGNACGSNYTCCRTGHHGSLTGPSCRKTEFDSYNCGGCGEYCLPDDPYSGTWGERCWYGECEQVEHKDDWPGSMKHETTPPPVIV